MTQTFSKGSNRTSGNRWGVVAAVVGVAIVLGLLNACTRQPIGTLTGDEPPIRVKGGSVEIELAWNTHQFDEEPNTTEPGKNWVVKDAKRQRNRFLVVIVSNNSNCNGVVRRGNKVDLEYSDGQKIDFQIIGGPDNTVRTKIKGQPNVLTKVSDQLLRYGVPNEPSPTAEYISKVTVGGGGQPEPCTFGRNDKPQIFILD